MKFCPDIADGAGFPIFPNDFTRVYDVYLKLGYKEMSLFEIDLDQHGSKDRGFGMYRSYAMLRQSGML
jgi:hypothetical protein